MSQKFRTISNAVSAGRKLNELAERNKRNVTYYMEPDGAAHVFTLTDAETVRTYLRNPILLWFIIEYAMTYTDWQWQSLRLYLLRQGKYLCLLYFKKVIVSCDYFVYVLILKTRTVCSEKTVLSVWPNIALLFATEEITASNDKCTDGTEPQNHFPNLGGHQIPEDSNGKMASRKKY